MRFYITDYLTNDMKEDYKNKGLYCYDLRESDDGVEIATIEKRVIVNNVGHIIIDNELENEITDYRTFVEENKMVNSIEELLNKEVLNMTPIGVDNWHRPVYKDEKGNIYKDINLGSGVISLYTVCNNDFYGEPDFPIDNAIEIKIIKNKEREER